MKQNKLLTHFLLFTFLLSLSSYASIITGNLYDLELNKIEDAIVQIDSTPQQTKISKDGSYMFEVSNGKYTITARQEKKELITKEKFTITGEGSYVLDLILFPSLEEEEFLFNETEEENEETFYEINYFSLKIIFIIAAILIVVFLAAKRVWQKSEHTTVSSHHESKTQNEKTQKPLDNLAQQVLDFIKKEQGRVTQKEIREQFPLSEAKISLIITELEEKGLVTKIKKGRGNIVVINQ